MSEIIALDFSPFTWRMLGLSVAISYLGFGTFILLGPSSISAGLLGLPSPSPPIAKLSTVSSSSLSEKSALLPANNSTIETLLLPPPPTAEVINANLVIKRALRLLGARDFSMGIALLLLDHLCMPQAMGALILAGLVLVMVDAWSLFTARGAGWGGSTAGGGLIWGWIGWNLLKMSRW